MEGCAEIGCSYQLRHHIDAKTPPGHGNAIPDMVRAELKRSLVPDEEWDMMRLSEGRLREKGRKRRMNLEKEGKSQAADEDEYSSGGEDIGDAEEMRNQMDAGSRQGSVDLQYAEDADSTVEPSAVTSSSTSSSAGTSSSSSTVATSAWVLSSTSSSTTSAGASSATTSESLSCAAAAGATSSGAKRATRAAPKSGWQRPIKGRPPGTGARGGIVPAAGKGGSVASPFKAAAAGMGAPVPCVVKGTAHGKAPMGAMVVAPMFKSGAAGMKATAALAGNTGSRGPASMRAPATRGTGMRAPVTPCGKDGAAVTGTTAARSAPRGQSGTPVMRATGVAAGMGAPVAPRGNGGAAIMGSMVAPGGGTGTGRMEAGRKTGHASEFEQRPQERGMLGKRGLDAVGGRHVQPAKKHHSLPAQHSPSAEGKASVLQPEGQEIREVECGSRMPPPRMRQPNASAPVKVCTICQQGEPEPRACTSCMKPPPWLDPSHVLHRPVQQADDGWRLEPEACAVHGVHQVGSQGLAREEGEMTAAAGVMG